MKIECEVKLLPQDKSQDYGPGFDQYKGRIFKNFVDSKLDKENIERLIK